MLCVCARKQTKLEVELQRGPQSRSRASYVRIDGSLLPAKKQEQLDKFRLFGLAKNGFPDRFLEYS